MAKQTILSLAPVAALTATATGGGVDVSDFGGPCKLVLDASAVGGTAGPGMVTKIQHSDTLGGAYVDTGVQFAPVAGVASFQTLDISVDGFKRFIRVVDTLSGTNPTVARSVTLVGNKAL